MSGLKHSNTIRDYTSFVADLKSDLSRLQEDMKLQIYNHYPAFVTAFQDLHSLEQVTTKPYEDCLEALQTVAEQLETLEISAKEAVQPAKSTIGDWEERLDELDSLVSEKRYESACDLIDSVARQDTNDHKNRLLFDIQALKLVDTVAAQLADLQTPNPKALVHVLKRLKAVKAAQDAFLLGKSKNLRVIIQRIESKEPILRATEIAKAFFTLVKDTEKEATELLGDSSCVYFWGKKETLYVSKVAGEALSMVDDLKKLVQCVRDMDALSRLDGLDLSQAWSHSLTPYLLDLLNEHVTSIRANLDSKLRSELWKQQVVQLHINSEILVIRLSSTAAALHKDTIYLLDFASDVIDINPVLACELLPKVLILIQSLFQAFLNSKALTGKKKMTQLVVLCCDFWNMAAVARETENRLEALLDSNRLYDVTELVSTAKAKFSSELTEFFSPLYTDRAKAYLSSLESDTDPRLPRDITDSKCGEVLSVLRELHVTVSSSTDHDQTACSVLVDCVSTVWCERLETLLFEVDGYWSVNSKRYT